MGKYIIELEDNESVYKTIIASGYPMLQVIVPAPYTEPDLEQVKRDYDAWYEKGLADAWEAARKIGSNSMCSLKEMGFDFSQCAVSDYNPSWFVVKNYSASEAIEKIRQYEQEKEEQITKGDIVLIKSTPEVEILVTYADEEYVSGIALTEVVDNCEIGDQYTDIRICNVEKTGKHYDIVSVLQKMKES